MSVVVTIVAGVAAWTAIATGAAIGIGRAIRIADAATSDPEMADAL